MIKISQEANVMYPNAIYGIMIVKCKEIKENSKGFSETKKSEIAKLLEYYSDYDRKEMCGREPICHYVKYYKKFNKTYPVLLQFESILLKGKDIPKVGAFIETMFLSEVKNLLLTAGHDLDKIQLPLKINVANGGETFIGISKTNQIMTKNDLYLSDDQNVISSILNGPDYHTRITENTRNVLYFLYGVDGISNEQIKKHFKDLQYYLSIFLPTATIECIDIIE